jgi:hypothetical protein
MKELEAFNKKIKEHRDLIKDLEENTDNLTQLWKENLKYPTLRKN